MSDAILVLLVEDDDVARDNFRNALEQAGFTVEAVDDGGDGLSRLKAQPGAFGAVVTDVNLPTLSGPDMIAQAGGALGAAGVIYLSGFAPEAGWPQGRILSKPIAKDELVRAVRDVTGPAA
jgi:DNA-binding response OmpR family regulator